MKTRIKIILFTSVLSLERCTCTLFNMAVALFLLDLGGKTSLTVLGAIYMTIQLVPLGILSVLLGSWIDNTDRFEAVLRTLAVKTGCILIVFCSAATTIVAYSHIGFVLALPILLIIVVVSSIANAMHLILSIAVDRVWIAVASSPEYHPISFLYHCNSWASAGKDMMQLVSILFFRKLSSTFNIHLTLLSLSLLIILSVVTQYFIFKILHKKHLPQQVMCLNGYQRTFKMSIEEFVRQRDAPVGICWALRSVFTALWLATIIMENGSMGEVYKWLLLGISVTTSLIFTTCRPKYSSNVTLLAVACLEIIAVLFASIPILSSKLEVESIFEGRPRDSDSANSAYHAVTLTLNQIIPKVKQTATHVVLVIGLILGAVCQRSWDIIALTLFQENVGSRSRATVGGVQYLFNYIALAFHGILVLLSRGNEYLWVCAITGLTQALLSVVILVLWRRNKSSESVALLRINSGEIPIEYNDSVTETSFQTRSSANT